MRVAFAGKGGSGKSLIAGTLVRTLGRSGEEVLAIDSDPMPGLAWYIGIPVVDDGLPDEVVEEGPEGGPRYVLRDGLNPADAVDQYAVRGPDGIRFMQFGNLRGGVGGAQRSQHAFNHIAKGVGDGRWHLVGDLSAGTRQAYAGWASYADTVIVVVEPSVKSMQTGRRLARMADPTGRRAGAHIPAVVAVANKVVDPVDTVVIAERTGLQVVASVPWDPAIAAAERNRRAPIDEAPDSPAVVAVASLARQLRNGRQPLEVGP